MERLAFTGRDATVRSAAAEALGEAPASEALPALERMFAKGDWPTRQAAGRAITRPGGRPAQKALGRRGFHGQADARKYAVTLLLLSSIPSADPLLERIRTAHPDDPVRHLASGGSPKGED